MTDFHGDDALAAKLRTVLGSRGGAAAVATVCRGESALASVGAPLEADFEIGSISKGITGLLYADALGRGELIPASPLGALLALGECEAAGVTVGSLSTHSSGLPRLPRSAGQLRTTLSLWRHGANPYGASLAQLLVQARAVKLSRPRPRYSNLGYQLLGHAVAAAAGATYPDLLRSRLAGPLGLDSFYAPAGPDQLRPGALIGSKRSGKPAEPWTGEALAPAGGLRASVGDMARLLAALLDGSAPGSSALDPAARFGSGAWIGAGWMTMDIRGHRLTWHNGATGGFRTWLGFDRARRIGVIAMSASSLPVDGLGIRMLQELAATGR